MQHCRLLYSHFSSCFITQYFRHRSHMKEHIFVAIWLKWTQKWLPAQNGAIRKDSATHLLKKKGRGGSNGDEPCPNAAAQRYASKRCSQSFTAVSHSSRWSNRNAAATVPSVLVRREWEQKVSRNNNEVQKPESNVWFLAVLLCTECAGMLCAACVRDHEGKKRLKVLAGTAAEIRSSSCMCEGHVQLHGHFFCLFSFLKLCYTFDEWLRLCICTVWCILSVSPQSFFPYLSLSVSIFLSLREKLIQQSEEKTVSD